jgi:cytoskeletal protein CcmA (bactofilin family)
MSFFGKTQGNSPKQSAGAVARETVSRFVSSGDNDISIIGPGMRISGDVVTEGTLRIEGQVEGTVHSSRMVVLGKSGEVIGNILAQEVVIGGRVTGTVVAENRLELQSTAVIDGEIRARAQHFQLDEGARFNGQICMVDPEQETPRQLPRQTTSAPDFSTETESAASDSRVLA